MCKKLSQSKTCPWKYAMKYQYHMFYGNTFVVIMKLQKQRYFSHLFMSEVDTICHIHGLLGGDCGLAV